MKKIAPSFIAIALAALSAQVFAAPNPATATFEVKITVLKACSVSTGTAANIDFGSKDASATGLSGSSAISVTCSKKTPYAVGMIPANADTTGAGEMLAQNAAGVTGNSDKVKYQLRTATGAAGPKWGTATSATVGPVTGTGNGSAQSIPVYATITDGDANVTPDAYKDTVTVQVVY